MRVVAGEAIHTIWAVEQGQLVPMETTRHRAGEVLPAPPHMIHSMEDGGGETPLITLHLYTDAIDHMIVYDLETQDTYVVDGSCGAWIPSCPSTGLRERHEGIVDPSHLSQPGQG